MKSILKIKKKTKQKTRLLHMHQSPLYILLYIKCFNFKNNIKGKTGIIKSGHKRGFIYCYRYTFIFLFYLLLFIEY